MSLKAYIIRLKEDKYWVGFTGDIEKRLHQIKQQESGIPHWIRHYPYEELIGSILISEDIDPREFTAEITNIYKNTFGYDNVRGTGYERVDEDIIAVKEIITNKEETPVRKKSYINFDEPIDINAIHKLREDNTGSLMDFFKK